MVIEEGEKNLRVRCTLCAPTQKTLSSAHNTTSNFKKLLDTIHKATKLVTKEPAKESDQEIVLEMMKGLLEQSDNAFFTNEIDEFDVRMYHFINEIDEFDVRIYC